MRAIYLGSIYDAMDDQVVEEMHRLAIPGAMLAIVEGDRIVHARGFGRARPSGQAPTPQTPFAIGSLTKAITATAVMQLVESGKIKLDDPVQSYLPWFKVKDPEAAAKITVRHLLNHISGLPSWCGESFLADFDQQSGAEKLQARQLATVKLCHPVGESFEYCNMNYNLLGLIIEAASGAGYPRYLQEHVLDPLRMGHTFTSETRARRHGMAVGHQMWFWTPVARPGLPMPSGSLASGQLISSAEDMAHFLIAHLNRGQYETERILPLTRIEELHRGATDVTAMGRSLGQYGMGWFVGEVAGTRVLWHAGCVPDFTAVMALLPEQQRGLILLVNAGHYMMNPAMSEVGLRLATLLAGERRAPDVFGFDRFAPWLMRALVVLPLLQVPGIASELRRLRKRRQEVPQGQRRDRSWWRRVALPLLPSLVWIWVPIRLLGSRRRGFLRLFLPDFYWTAMISGGLALGWALIRTALNLRARPPRSAAGSPRGHASHQ